MSPDRIAFAARILRKRADLPRHVIVKPGQVGGRTASFAADVALNGTAPFARNVRPWGKGSDAFFFNLTESQWRRAGVETGDDCEVGIVPRG